MPKPTVTKLIQTLEAHLRTKLLNRTTRRVVVTPDGAAYYERAIRLLDRARRARRQHDPVAVQPEGRLRIDVSASLAMLVIIPALPAFHARYPDIQIDLGATDRAVDLVGENVDCVVRGGALSDQSLVARRIGEMNFITCAAPAYLDRHGAPRHPADLEADHHAVAYFNPAPGGSTASTSRAAASGSRSTRATSSPSTRPMPTSRPALAGLGVMQAPSFMVEAHLEQRRPAARAGRMDSDPIMPLHVVYPPNRHLSNKVRVFVDWIADLFAGDRLIRRRAAPTA